MANVKHSAWLEPNSLERLEGWARDGATDAEIARNMGICIRTFYKWKKAYPPIAEALKRGAETTGKHVEQALLKRALGYDHEEITRELSIDSVTGEQKVKSIKIVTKHVMPNISAQLFWLKNRQPENWRDKPVDRSADQPSELMRSLCALLEAREK